MLQFCNVGQEASFTGLTYHISMRDDNGNNCLSTAAISLVPSAAQVFAKFGGAVGLIAWESLDDFPHACRSGTALLHYLEVHVFPLVPGKCKNNACRL
jgi:hypothetical protein